MPAVATLPLLLLLMVASAGAHMATLGLLPALGAAVTVQLRQLPHTPFPKVVGYFSGVEDAVDPGSFPPELPYGRSQDWNAMLMHSGAVQYRVGQIFKHARHGYHAAIVAIDPRPVVANQEWLDRMGTSSLARGTEQPFYWSIVDVRDRKPAMMAYVAEDDVAPAEVPHAAGFAHDDAAVFFDRPQTETLHGTDESGFLRGVAQGAHLDFKVGHGVQIWVGSRWADAIVDAPVDLESDQIRIRVQAEDGTISEVTPSAIREPWEYREGDVVEARWKKGSVWYKGKVSRCVSEANQTYSISFDDGDKDELPAELMRVHGPAERARRAQATDFHLNAMPFNGFGS